MTDTADADLYTRVEALLEPGDIQLNGIVVHTDLTTDEEPTLHQATIDIGNVIAERAGLDPTDTYVHSGNDDSRFGVNQHQGLTLDGDEFVWECQQLLREGTYDVVIYYEANDNHASVVTDVEAMGFRVKGIEG